MKMTMHGWRQPIAGRLLRLVLAALLGVAAAARGGEYQGSPQVAEFIAQMTRDHGFASEQLAALFGQVQRKQSILDAIARPAERTRAWREYRPMFISDARIARGVEFWRQNRQALQRAEQAYGVPAQIIVAIIGVETFYGRNTGNFRVADALSTLCFDYPARAAFFCEQLREFLLLAREEQVDPLSVTGSYAGAMGLPQFMPGSFRAYAVDFDNDGHIDIWNNATDAIGSVANYFHQHGWQTGEPVVSRAAVHGSQVDEGLADGLEPVKTVGQLRALGWVSQLAIADDVPVTAFRLDGEAGPEYWMGMANFYVITRYNRSAMYAMAVYQLADLLAQTRGAP